jgi:hypothetical protein
LLAKERLKDLLHEDKYIQYQKILFILAVDVDTPKPVNVIKVIGSKAGLREIYKWRPGAILQKYRKNKYAVHLDDGWILTSKGKRYLTEELKIGIKPVRVTEVTKSLRDLLKDIEDDNTKNFLKEAISCFENNNFRAAVVLSWIGAVSVLQNYVITNYLSDFNTEARRRDARWRNARTVDDLGRMKEIEFLNILVSISVLSKNVKQELEKCLILRNSCGHPNSYDIRENKVAAHMEDLITNVFKKY